MERDMESESARVTKVPPRADMSCQVRLMGKWISLCLSPPFAPLWLFWQMVQCRTDDKTDRQSAPPTKK
jgi:hypothetical protein